MAIEAIGVTALNLYVKSLLEADAVLSDIAVKGEISNFNRHYKTRHCYFSIRDEKASVKAVMFRREADRLRFTPENGMKVILRCRVSLYERDGAFQLYVDDIFPDGLGAMQIAFEQMRARLEREGLFAAQHKKPLPAYPGRVGLVTSKTGAALQDILKVAQGRCPLASFVLSPAQVQGDAAPQVCAAIEKLDKHRLADAIIVARGGGSAEDLWLFNDERIARCVFACKTPVISAIGHEIDFTILDLVADARAATPSAAAEMLLPDLYESLGYMTRIGANISNAIHKQYNSCYNILDKDKLLQAMRNKYSLAQRRLAADAQLAHAVNPYAVLARGYGLARGEDGAVLQSIAQIKPRDNFTLSLKDGDIFARAQEVQARETEADIWKK